jgi:hypothetical protein
MPETGPDEMTAAQLEDLIRETGGRLGALVAQLAQRDRPAAARMAGEIQDGFRTPRHDLS